MAAKLTRRNFIKTTLVAAGAVALEACANAPTATPVPPEPTATPVPQATAAPPTATPALDPYSLDNIKQLPGAPLKAKGWSWPFTNPVADAKSFSDMIAIQELQKRTGLTYDWTHAPGWEGEQLNLIFASGDLPDFFCGLDASTCVQRGTEGALAPLEELIAAYGPNFTKVLKDYPDMAGQLYAPDGHIYTLPRLSLDKRLWAFTGFIIRQDWLDEIGAKPPETVEDLYTVLKEFKAKDANRYPLGAYEAALIWQWGIGMNTYANDGHFHVENGKVGFGPADPRWADAMAYLNKLFTEGLIEPTVITGAAETATDQVLKNMTTDVSGFMFGSWGSHMNPFQKKMTHGQLVGMAPPAGPNGWRDVLGCGSYFGWGGAISAASKLKNEMMAFWDNVYGPAGNWLINFGIKGDTYDLDAKGTPVFTQKVQDKAASMKMSLMEWEWTYLCPNWLGPMILEYDSWAPGLSDEGKKANALITPYVGQHKLPQLFLSTDENEVIKAKMPDIGTLVTENYAKFLTGSRPLGEIKDFVADLKTAGIDDVLAAYQSRYDFVLSKMK